VVTDEISVVVCTYSEARWRDLRATLRSLQAQTQLATEIVVAVDHNAALLARIRRELAGVRAVPNDEPPGLGGTRNAGVRAARGSIVAFIDDDAIASREWLSTLAAGYTDEAVAGVGGAIEPAWPSGRPRWFPPEFDWVVGCTYRGMPETPQEVRNLIGCNMSFRRERLLDVGLFRLGYSCDETELCIRLRQRRPGDKLLYIPAAKVMHQISSDRTSFRRFLARCYFEGGSKAVVSRLVGAHESLASERRYTATVLPSGVRQGVGDALRRRDPAGIGRAGAIVAGLGCTSAGFVLAGISFEAAARRRGWHGATI
jgi:GT2 family glycosyltransferase